MTASDERVQLGHNSPLLVADPDDSRFVVVASRLDNPDFGCSLAVSHDGGRSWAPVQPVPELPPGADKCYAPEAAFGPRGALYYLFVGLAGEGNTPSGAYLVTSDDRGASFSPPRRVLGPERYMVRMAVDRARGGRGRIHLVWLEVAGDSPLGGLPPTANPILSAHSDDGGRSFSTPVAVSDPARRRVVAPALALGPDNSVHVVFYDLGDDARDYQGLEGPTWEGTWSLLAASSTDGGATFGPNVEVAAAVVPPERVMLIFTMAPPALAVDDGGRLFAAWYDARNGDWDVFLRRSTDGGRSWGAPRRLNDDAVANGRHQYLPRLSTSPGGRLDAVFYDRRDDPGNVFNDVRITWSVDAGATFSPNLGVTADSFSSQIGTRYPIPSATGLVEFGSRIAVFSLRDRALVAWTDTRHTNADSYSQDVLATEVDFEAAAAAEPEPRPGPGPAPGSRRWPAAAVVLTGLALVVLAGRGRARRYRAARTAPR